MGASQMLVWARVKCYLPARVATEVPSSVPKYRLHHVASEEGVNRGWGGGVIEGGGERVNRGRGGGG